MDSSLKPLKSENVPETSTLVVTRAELDMSKKQFDQKVFDVIGLL